MKITIDIDPDWYKMLKSRILPRMLSNTVDTLEEELAAAIVVCVENNGDAIEIYRGHPPLPFGDRFKPGRN